MKGINMKTRVLTDDALVVLVAIYGAIIGCVIYLSLYV